VNKHIVERRTVQYCVSPNVTLSNVILFGIAYFDCPYADEEHVYVAVQHVFEFGIMPLPE